MKYYPRLLIIFFSVIILINPVTGARSTTLKQAIKAGPGRYKLMDSSISLEKIPGTVDEFIALRNKIAKKPEGGFAMLIVAMIKYSNDKEMGMKFFVMAMDRSKLIKSSSEMSYKGYFPKNSAMWSIRMMNTRPYLGHIYITGTSYKNGYKLPALPYVIRFSQITVLPKGEVKLFAFTTSGNSPRPVALRKNNRGIWKAFEFSSVFTGISRLPQKNVDDDL